MLGQKVLRFGLTAAQVAAVLLVLPSRVAAAEPPVIHSDGGAAPLLVILLLGSLTAGLFFASPLRRRLTDPSPTGAAGRSPALGRVRERVVPVGHLLQRAQRTADGVLDSLGRQVVDRGRRLGSARPDTPLPPMLGGDIFFEDEPTPRLPEGGRPVAANGAVPFTVPNAPAGAPAHGGDPQPDRRPDPVPTPGPAAPWSTGPVSDDRYWPAG
jgi:hypothetical protein